MNRFDRFGVRVGRDQVKGRGLYCNQAFVPGDALFFGRAFSSIVNGSCWTKRCMVCFVPEDEAPQGVSLCRKCGLVAFCSKECLAADCWHHEECKALRRLDQVFRQDAGDMSLESGGKMAQLIMVARVLRSSTRMEKHSEEEHPEKALHDNEGHLIESTASDLQDMMQIPDSRTLPIFKKSAQLLFQVDREKVLLPKALHSRYGSDPKHATREVVHCMNQMQINNFKMTDHRFAAVAEVCDPVTALINHSCEPNACLVFHCPALPGNQVCHTVRCIRPLQPGQEVLIAYVDPRRPWWARQQALQSSHGFLCSCTTCADIASYISLCSSQGCQRNEIPVPECVRSSIASVANRSGMLMSETFQGNDALRHLLQDKLCCSFAKLNEQETTAIQMAAKLLIALTDATNEAPHTLAPEIARKKLNLLSAPIKTLLHLLGSGNSVFQTFNKVMYLAEACGDWAQCIFLAPVVLESLASTMSLLRADILALEAKAKALHFLDAGSQAAPSLPSSLMEWQAVMTVCETAIASLYAIHGSSCSRVPRAYELQNILDKLKESQTFAQLPPLDLDELD